MFLKGGGRIINTYVNPYLGEFETVLEEHKQHIYFEGRKLVRYSNNKDYFDEVIQEGNIGLFEAYKKYDPNRYSVKFWSYAWLRVRGSMIRFIGRHSNFLKPNRIIESISNKIKKLDMMDWDVREISKAINQPIIQVNEALEFLRIKYVDSLNRTIYVDNEQGVELGDIISDKYDYFEKTEEELWKSLNKEEHQYLNFKLQNWSARKIQQEMHLTQVKQNELEASLRNKTERIFSLENNRAGVPFMTSSDAKLLLTKEEYLKLKKKNIIDKEVCEKYSVSKSTLIKFKASWGISNSRSTKTKRKTIAISSSPKKLNIEINGIEGNKNINQVDELLVKISDLERKLTETEKKLRVCENEREALWRIQDILRSRAN